MNYMTEIEEKMWELFFGSVSTPYTYTIYRYLVFEHFLLIFFLIQFLVIPTCEGIGNDKSWNVSVVVDTLSQVKHCTDDINFPSKTSVITERYVLGFRLITTSTGTLVGER